MPTVWAIYQGAGVFRVRARASLEECQEHFHQGDAIKITVNVSRNDKYHRLFFAIIGKCVKAINAGPTQVTKEGLLRWLKLHMGHFDVIAVPNGKQFGASQAIEYGSIAYDAMDQEEFAEFVEGALGLVRDQLAPWLNTAPEWPEIVEMLTHAGIETGDE